MRGILSRSGAGRQAGGGSGACARALRPRACAYWREEEDDKGEEVGWAGWASQMELGQALVGCTVRPGNFLLSLSFSNYLSFLLFCKFRALLKILRHFQKS